MLDVLAQVLDVNFDPNHVNIVHRVNTREGKIRPIVANIYSKEIRRNWVVRARKKQVAKNLPESTIYIGEHMSPHYKMLLSKAKTAIKLRNSKVQVTGEEIFKYAWFSDGKILIRKTEGEKAVQIMSEVDIEKHIGHLN